MATENTGRNQERNAKKWDERCKQAVMLRKQGLTYQAICKQLGCGPNALNQQFKKRAKVIKNFSKNNGLYNSFQRESLFPIESIQHTIFQGAGQSHEKYSLISSRYMR